MPQRDAGKAIYESKLACMRNNKASWASEHSITGGGGGGGGGVLEFFELDKLFISFLQNFTFSHSASNKIFMSLS